MPASPGRTRTPAAHATAAKPVSRHAPGARPLSPSWTRLAEPAGARGVASPAVAVERGRDLGPYVSPSSPSRPRVGPATWQAGAEAEAAPAPSRRPHFDFARTPIVAPPVQRKAAVSSPGDPHEREADRIADALVDEVAVSVHPQPAHDVVQRKCGCAAGAKCPACEEEERSVRVQRKAGLAGPSSSPELDLRPTDDGAPIPAEVRAPLEGRMGFDFARVRIHTGPRAAEAARSIQAHAYTLGRHIVFAQGAASFHSREGRRLLAHELVHVAQQGAAGGLGARREAGSPGARSLRPAPHMAISPAAPADRAQRQTDVAAIDAAIAENERQAAATRDPAELDRLFARRNELLAERRQATQAAGAGAPHEPASGDPAAARRAGFPLAAYDRQTHWGSQEERRRWIVENLPRAVFDSPEERARYEALAHPPADPALAAYLGLAPPAGAPARPFSPAVAPLALGSSTRGAPTREPRVVPVHQFASTGLWGPTLPLGSGYRVQTEPDRTSGYNFDTYLYNSATGQRIPAFHLGGTRYRVLMGSEECPGCHLGRGLEVDLHGQHFLMVAAPMILSGLGALGRAPAGGAPVPPGARPPVMGPGGSRGMGQVIPLRPPPAPVIGQPAGPGAGPYAFAGNGALSLAPRPVPVVPPAAGPLAQVIPFPRPFAPPVTPLVPPGPAPFAPGMLSLPFMQPYAGSRDHRRRQQAPLTFTEGVDYDPSPNAGPRNPCDMYRVPTCASLRASGTNYAYTDVQRALTSAILDLPPDRRGQSFMSRGSEVSRSGYSPCSAATSDRPGTHDTFWSADDRTKITVVCCPCCEPASPIPTFAPLCAVHNVELF